MVKQLRFRYVLRAAYSQPVRHHSFSVKFLPGDTDRQSIDSLTVRVMDGDAFLTAQDNFGNLRIYGTIEQPHDSFDVEICGTARTGLDIFEEYTDDLFKVSLFRAQTSLTLPGEGIRQYHKEMAFPDDSGPYDKALAIMQRLYDTYRYIPGRTGVHEPAESAFALGAGVCQDYAHIMLSLLRLEGIPARYIVGMLPGEGASHAWVEALCKGYWYGFDPANGKLVDDSYIRVSCGRDSADCAVIRGSFIGLAVQEQEESVTVTEL